MGQKFNPAREIRKAKKLLRGGEIEDKKRKELGRRFRILCHVCPDPADVPIQGAFFCKQHAVEIAEKIKQMKNNNHDKSNANAGQVPEGNQ